MAFASAWTPAPTAGRTAWTAGTARLVRARPSVARGSRSSAVVMRFGVDMDKYSRMAGGKPTAGKYASMATSSTGLDKYARMTGFSPGTMSAGSRLATEGTWSQYLSKLVSLRQMPQGRGAAAGTTGIKARDGPKVDAYVAECVRSQYKRQANPAGVVRWVARLRGCGLSVGQSIRKLPAYRMSMTALN